MSARRSIVRAALPVLALAGSAGAAGPAPVAHAGARAAVSSCAALPPPPGALVGIPARGQVDVRRTALVTEATTNLATAGVAPAVGFGSAVLNADVNGDHCLDLVVGAPHTASAGPDTGAVDIFLAVPPGSATAPGPGGYDTSHVIRIDGPHPGGLFGAALAVHHRAGATDLYVGSPGYSFPGYAGAGRVYGYQILAGEHPVPSVAGAAISTQAHAGNHFGAVLDVASDLLHPGQDSNPMLAVGEPDAWVGARAGAGVVEFATIQANGTLGLWRRYSQDSAGVPGAAEAGDHFGASVSLGPDGTPTVVGAPGEDLGPARDAGMVQVLTLGPPGTRTVIGPALSQDTPGIPGVAEAGDHFGAAVLDLPGPNPGARLAYVGSPGEDVGAIGDAGQVQLITVTTTTATGGTTLTQGSGGLLDVLEPGDQTGSRLAATAQVSPVDAQPVLLVEIAAPGEDGAHTTDAGLVFVNLQDDEPDTPAWTRFGYPGGAVTGLRYGAALGRLG